MVFWKGHLYKDSVAKNKVWMLWLWILRPFFSRTEAFFPGDGPQPAASSLAHGERQPVVPAHAASLPALRPKATPPHPGQRWDAAPGPFGLCQLSTGPRQRHRASLLGGWAGGGSPVPLLPRRAACMTGRTGSPGLHSLPGPPRRFWLPRACCGTPAAVSPLVP